MEPRNTESINVEIEDAKEEDVEGMLRVRKETWLATYPNEELGITKDDILTINMDSEAKAERWRGWIKEEDGHAFVAKVNGEVIGFGYARLEEVNNRIGALYILPEFQDKGIGRKLMERMIEWLGNEEDILLNVASYNTRAKTFYKGFGFVDTGNPPTLKSTVLPNGKEIPELEMVRSAN